MDQPLTLTTLEQFLRGSAVAIRCLSELQPAGGPGDKVFPPTYEGGAYAEEVRLIEGQEVRCVLLDSVQSQANRMELALLAQWERTRNEQDEAKRFPLPVIVVDFSKATLPSPIGRITSLEAPHRLADALLRDSVLGDGTPFSKSKYAKEWGVARPQNATALLRLCPTALVFGMWGSPQKPGGLGAKFQRAIVSEIVGLHAQLGKRTSSRIDPTGIRLQAGPLFAAKNGGWTLNEKEADRDKKGGLIKFGQDGKPSQANLGNVTPTIADGGYTISKAIQTTVLSLTALRRLCFPVDGKSSHDLDNTARTALAALGLCAATLARENAGDLRSRCHLVLTSTPEWEVLDRPGQQPKRYELASEDAVRLYTQAVASVHATKLPWLDKELELSPSPQLAELVRRSQELEATEVEPGE